VATFLQGDLAELEQEHLVVVLVDTKNRVMGQSTVCTGSLNSAAVRIGEIFKEAVRRNAAGVILAHNHPSGDPSPSAQDVQLTEEARKAGELLDVQLLDHLVIGRPDWVSLRERSPQLWSRRNGR
jgi:DNA repair protein RadC